VRLVGGSSSREGRLEVLHKGVWRSACYNYRNPNRYSGTRSVTDAAANLICSILGFGYVYTSNFYFLVPVPILYVNVKPSGMYLPANNVSS